MRWNLIDGFQVLKKGEYARAHKSFEGTEDFFAGHFPGEPLVPETLLIEMVAQTGGTLLGLGLDFGKEVILAKIASAKFGRAAAPPCRLEIEAVIEEEREEGAWIAGTVRSQGEVAGEVRLLLVTMDAIDGAEGKRVVFTEDFLKHYRVYEVARMSQIGS